MESKIHSPREKSTDEVIDATSRAGDGTPAPQDRPPDHERLKHLIFATAMVLLAFTALPSTYDSIMYPDSIEYLEWPSQIGQDGPRAMGPRMVSYPMVVAVMGTGPALVFGQHLLLFGGFAWFGWMAAGRIGALVLAALSLAPIARSWGWAVLSESLTLSLFAISAGCVLAVAQKPSLARIAALCIALAGFGWLRPSNLAMVPFLLVPLWNIPRKAALGLAALALLILLIGAIQIERGELWRTGHYVSVLTRVIPDSEARAYFREHGLPAEPFGTDAEAFTEWFDQHAEATFRKWIFLRAESYGTAWSWMSVPESSEFIQEHYFKGRLADNPGPMNTAAGLVFDGLSLSPWAWLLAFVIPTWICVRGRGRESLSLLCVSLGAACYAQTFLGYHGSGSGEVRHLLLAQVMMRLALFLAVVVTVREVITRWHSRARPREPEHAANSRGNNEAAL